MSDYKGKKTFTLFSDRYDKGMEVYHDEYVEWLEAQVERLRQACDIYRNASFQSHSGHWDSQQTHGRNCPECNRADELRRQADEVLAPKGAQSNE